MVCVARLGSAIHVFLHDAQDAPKQRQYKLLTGLVEVHGDILPPPPMAMAIATDVYVSN